MKIQQLKLTNGDEVICSVVGWVEDQGELVVTNALEINELIQPIKLDDGEQYRYHTLRPWMMYQQNISTTIYVNLNSVISYCDPSAKMLDQYNTAVESFMESFVKEEVDQKDLFQQDSDTPNNIISFRKLHIPPRADR